MIMKCEYEIIFEYNQIQNILIWSIKQLCVHVHALPKKILNSVPRSQSLVYLRLCVVIIHHKLLPWLVCD